MKKIYISALFAFLGIAAMAQSYFTTVSYRGAFDPNAAMWTDTWCNWDPQNASYGAPTVTVNANITTNTTWTSGNVYLLQGQIYVKGGATLTIQAGTVIRGDYSTVGSGLFITKGSKISAIGTASSPIVFTSSQAAGSRASGDWGGIILLGQAGNNQPGGKAYVEGIATSADTEYGGGTSSDDGDNSGTMQYVRIEYPGYVYAPNKEINGLTLGAVGSGTIIDHIQVSFSNDDSYEWFGGSVSCKYLVAYRGLDDDFDTDNGYHGNVQFALGVRDPNIADNPTVSTSEGFESDNDGSGSAANPFTSAVFSNITIVGPLRGNVSSTVAAGYRRAVRIRRNSQLRIFNSVLIDHLRGVMIDGTACEDNAKAGIIGFKYNVLAGNQAGKVCEVTTGSAFDIRKWFKDNSNDSLVASSGILVSPYNYTSPDYRPASGSIAASGANFTDAALSIKEAKETFNQVGLFPNPASTNATLQIESKTTLSINVKVIDVTGRVVIELANDQKINSGSNSIEINTSTLETGLYFVILSDNENLTQQSYKLAINK